MTFQQLIYVVEIAKCGSINRAANKLFISQSSVSSALKQLESELQIEIFSRSNFGITLTETGRNFISYATALLERKAEIETLFTPRKENKGQNHTRFSVISQHYQCSAAAFTRLFQSMNLDSFNLTYKEDCMESVINSVTEKKADLGIIIISNYSESLAEYYLSKRSLEFHIIRELQPGIFCSKFHPLAERSKVTLDDLSEYPYITFSHNQDMPIDFSEGVNMLSMLNHKKHFITNDRSAMINLLCNTNAVSTGSGLIVDGFTDSRLISIPLADSNEIMKFGWISEKDYELSPLGSSYIEVLTEIVNDSLAYTKNLRYKTYL